MNPSKHQTLAVIGQGYVGLPLAMAAVDAGWLVIGIDNLPAKVTQINSGSSPVEGISDIELQAAISCGAYLASSDFSMVSQASVITICVPTPLDEMHKPDLSLLRNATIGIAPHISNETLVVSESTSYPGTLREIIIPLVESLKPVDSETLYFASAPERVNPGDPVWNQKNTPRLVGAINEASLIKANSFYKSICDDAILVSKPEIAEAAKLLENTFRLVNIALINEFTLMCSSNGIDVNEVIDAAATKPYGFMPFRPGVGVGGHCIPVDPIYLSWWANKLGCEARIIETADSINRQMSEFVANRILRMIKSSKKNPKILILGIAYKAGVSDVRESPVIRLIDSLRQAGATVAWHDPLVKRFGGEESVSVQWECDACVIAVNQPGVDIESITRRDLPILDCTNSFRDNPNIETL